MRASTWAGGLQPAQVPAAQDALQELRQLLPAVEGRFPRHGSWEDFVKNAAARWLLLNASKEGMTRRSPDDIGGRANGRADGCGASVHTVDRLWVQGVHLPCQPPSASMPSHLNCLNCFHGWHAQEAIALCRRNVMSLGTMIAGGSYGRTLHAMQLESFAARSGGQDPPPRTSPQC